MMKSHLVICLVFLSSISTTATYSSAQSASMIQRQTRDQDMAEEIANVFNVQQGWRSENAIVEVQSRTSDQAYRAALQAILAHHAEAQTETSKQDVRKKLGQHLSRRFDADVETRRAELEAIKQRVAEMETLLQKRVANRDSIVRLRAQVLLNHANGLGWGPSNPADERAQPSSVKLWPGMRIAPSISLPTLPGKPGIKYVRPADTGSL